MCDTIPIFRWIPWIKQHASVFHHLGPFIWEDIFFNMVPTSLASPLDHKIGEAGFEDFNDKKLLYD